MFSFQNIELYDPESPSVDDDLYLERDQSNTCKVSCVGSYESSANLSNENEDAENQECSATEDSAQLACSECTTITHDNQKCQPDVTRRDEHVKPAVVSKPALIWKSTKKMLGVSVLECAGVQTSKENTVKASSNVTALDVSSRLPDLNHSKQSQQQQGSNSDCFSNDSVNSVVCDSLDNVNALRVSSVSEPVSSSVAELITVKEVHACDRNSECENVETSNEKVVHGTLQRTLTSEPDDVLQNSHTNTIVDIAEPTEPCDDGDQTAFSQQPRTIKLSRIEDPLEPDELFQTSDPNSNNRYVTHPRIIRLDRDGGTESCSTEHPSDISDPSEPTDTEPIDDQSLGAIPREIKLHRVDDAGNLLDSSAFRGELNSSSLLKPRVVQLNTLHAKTCTDYSSSSHVTETNPTVDSPENKSASEIVYCRDTPLSPTESVGSLSDSEDDQSYASESPIPRVLLFEDGNDCVVRDGENKVPQSHGTSTGMKSDQSVSTSSLRHLSDGEIVDEEEEQEEEFGIFQISASAGVDKERQNSEHHKKQSGKKRPYDGSDDDVGLQHHNKSEDGLDHPGSNKWQRMSRVVCTSEPSTSSSISDRSVTPETPVQHSLHDNTKATWSVLRNQKHDRHKTEQASRSPEKLLVRNSHSTKRKVVVISKTDDKSKKEKHFMSGSRKITPGIFQISLHENSPKSDVLEFERRTLNKRKHPSKRHRKHRVHRNESHAHKHKGRWTHKKHKRRKHRSDTAGSLDGYEQRHNRGRSRSYDRIVESIRCEEHLSNIRHLRSVVVHKNTLVSARQRSSSVSSYDSHHSVDNFATTDVGENSDSRRRNVSGGHMHLSRLSYSGEIEQDGRTTLLGECIKSKYGPDYDINCISRYLANLCSSNDDANDEVEILGVSYPREIQSKKDSLQNAGSSKPTDNASHEVAISLVQQPHVPVDQLSSVTGKESVAVRNPPRNDVGTNKIESRKVTMSTKEVQTQVSLFAAARDSVTECSMFSDGPNRKSCDDHGKADKELQVSDLDRKEQCIRSPSSTVAGGSEHVLLSEVVSGIQSPESHVEEGSHVPRPVLLERTDASEATPDSPHRDLSDLYVTVPNVSKSRLSLTKTIALEQVAQSADDTLPQVMTSDTSFVANNAAEQLQLGVVAVSSAESSSVSNAGIVQRKSQADATEQSSSKNGDSDVVCSNAHNKEQCQLPNHNTSVTKPAVHHLPPVVQQKPYQYQRAVPLRHVNPPSTEKFTVALSGSSSTVHLSGSSASQQLQSKSITDVTSCYQSQQPLVSQSLLAGARQAQSAATMLGDASSPVSPQLRRDNRNKSCSPEVPESLSFFTLKSDRIPGICEDVESDAGHYESRIGRSLSSHQSSLLPNSFLQTSESLGVINVVVTTAAVAVSETPQQTVTPSCTATSYVETSSEAVPLSSNQTSSASTSYSTAQGIAMPTVSASSSSSVVKQHMAPLLPLLGTIATRLFGTPVQQQATTVPASTSSTTVASTSTNSIIPAVSSRSSFVTVPALKYATTTVTSTDAVSAWITSLPQTSTPEKPQPRSPPVQKPSAELDFDVDAVESPRSDEIMSFSPPSSEHMMAVVKMKHTIGLKKKSSKNTTNGVKKPNKTARTVSVKILMNVEYCCACIGCLVLCM